MAWPLGKSYYEGQVEDALIQLSASFRLCSGYRYNRSTWFSGRLRYDFVLGADLPSLCIAPYLIEVHGEQHYRWDYSGNDAKKKQLAIEHGCPFLVIPYRSIGGANELLGLISRFLIAAGQRGVKPEVSEKLSRSRRLGSTNERTFCDSDLHGRYSQTVPYGPGFPP